MIKRQVRWFSMPIDRSQLQELAAAMASSAYSAERFHGFILNKVEPTLVSGRFIEKFERETFGIDPYGEEMYQSITMYHDVSFSVSTAPPGLQVTGPGPLKSLTTLLLLQLSTPLVPISAIDADPLDWLACIECGGARATATEIEYDIALGYGTTGSLVVRNAGEVRHEGRKFIRELPKVAKRVAARLLIPDSAPIVVELSRNGLAEMMEESPGALSLLQSSLLRAAYKY